MTCRTTCPTATRFIIHRSPDFIAQSFPQINHRASPTLTSLRSILVNFLFVPDPATHRLMIRHLITNLLQTKYLHYYLMGLGLIQVQAQFDLSPVQVQAQFDLRSVQI